MKKSIEIRSGFLLCLTAGFLLTSSTAAAGPILYSNGPLNGEENGFSIDAEVTGGYVVSDSFTVSLGSDATDVQFAAWLPTGDTATSINWAITTGATPFGALASPASSGTGTLLSSDPNNPIIGSGDQDSGFDVDFFSFALPNVALTTGTTYWLQLSGADVTNGDQMFWDENDGNSQAYMVALIDGVPDSLPYQSPNSVGSLADNEINGCGAGCSGSETFRILGSTAPEPGTLTTLLSGCLLLGATLLYKRRNASQLLPQTARIQPRN